MSQVPKLSLSKETLRTLDEQELTEVVGGRPAQTGVICVVAGQSLACRVNVEIDTVICNTGVCNSVVCGSVIVCQ